MVRPLSHLRSRIKLCALAAIVCSSVSCSPSIGSFNSLADQGILPLSAENPHLGANLFLAQEAQRSTYLYNFLQAKGGPAAIEVLTQGLNSPRILLFYPLKKEVYISDLAGKGNRMQWVVRGPYAIERNDYRDLAAMQVSSAAEPVFIVWGKETRFRQPIRMGPVRGEVQAVIPAPLPTPKPVKRRAPVIRAEGDTITKPGGFQPLNSDQQAIAISQGLAERAENGDVIHTVKGGAQTFAAISRWYTGGAGNSAAIAAQNGMNAAAPLAEGTRVRIPAKLVNQFKAMPAEYK